MRNASAWTASMLLATALAAGCSSSSTTPLAPIATSPNAANLAAPFAPLAFTVIPYTPQTTNGWQCYVGILTSKAQFPQSLVRASESRAIQSVFVPADGCDVFPVPNPIPTPPAPGPSPLAATTFSTAQIVAPSFAATIPSAAGWSGTLTFPACSSCDAGTSNGSIALDVLPSTTASDLAFALVFKNTAPQPAVSPAPSPGINPAPHVFELYGPPVGATASPQPIPTYISGAPVTLGFPSLAISLPAGSSISPTTLALTLTQKLTPPVYEEAIYSFDANGNPLPLPLTSSATYRPYATTGSTALFALPSTPFPFQTDFTEYDFNVASS